MPLTRSGLRRATALLGVVSVALLGFAAPAGAEEPPDQRVIVHLRDAASLAAATADVAADGGDIDHRYRRIFNGYAATITAEQAAALTADPNVLRVVPDEELHALETQSSATWGLDRADQRDLPLSGSYAYGQTGAGVTAFVLDTGVRATHAEFGGRVVGGVDFVEPGTTPDDCNGHGTHVAGTIAGATYGVAKQTTVVPVRILDCEGHGNLGNALAAFDWVIANKPNGPAVLNFSAGGDVAHSLVDAGAQAVLDAGISVVVAAGNEGNDACLSSPGRVPGVLTVGASDQYDVAPAWSDFGDCVDLFAPGDAVTSAWWTADTDTATTSGTSMASPHVAGAVARYLQMFPSASVTDVASFVNTTATPNKVAAPSSLNNRLLHVEGALPALPPPPVPAPPAPPVPSGRWSGTGAKVVRMAATTSGRLQIEYTGTGGRFAVWSLGRKGGKAELLVRERGAYSGTVAYPAGARKRSRVSGFAVEADGPWGMTPRSLASAPLLRAAARGRGDYVLRLSATTGRLRTSHTGRSNFSVITLNRAGTYDTLVVNDGGRSWGPTVVPRAARYVLISADGAWRVRRR